MIRNGGEGAPGAGGWRLLRAAAPAAAAAWLGAPAPPHAYAATQVRSGPSGSRRAAAGGVPARFLGGRRRDERCLRLLAPQPPGAQPAHLDPPAAHMLRESSDLRMLGGGGGLAAAVGETGGCCDRTLKE